MKFRWIFLIALILVGAGIKPEPPYIEQEKVQATESVSEPVEIDQVVDEPVETEKPAKPPETKPSEPEIDPQGCEPEQFWSEEPPHDCIDKPKPVEEQQRSQASITSEEPTSAPAYSGGGNKDTWLAASGIPQSSWWAVDSIVSGESGWNPTAVNPSSGACGLGQQLPCGKWGGDWTDPVHALKSMNTYVQAYGGWAAAVEFRNCTGWCYSARAEQEVHKDHTWY